MHEDIEDRLKIDDIVANGPPGRGSLTAPVAVLRTCFAAIPPTQLVMPNASIPSDRDQRGDGEENRREHSNSPLADEQVVDDERAPILHL